MPGQPSASERAAARRARVIARAGGGGVGSSVGSTIGTGLYDLYSGAKDTTVGAIGAIPEIGRGLYDIGSNLYAGGDRARATLSGFGQGARESAVNMFEHPGQTAADIIDPGIQATVGAAIDRKNRSAMYGIGRALPVAAGAMLGTKTGRSAVTSGARALERGAVGAAEKASGMFARPKVAPFQATTGVKLPIEPMMDLPTGNAPPASIGGSFPFTPQSSSYTSPGRVPRQLGEVSGSGLSSSWGPGASSTGVPPPPKFYAGGPGIPAEVAGGPRLGTVERGTPYPVSAGMGRTSQAQAAFEAQVPERFKTGVGYRPEAPGVGSGLGPVEPLTPGLPVLSEKGTMLKGTAAKAATTKGTKSLTQMVNEYGLDEAARRANMTPDEVGEMLVQKGAPVKVAPRVPVQEVPTKAPEPKMQTEPKKAAAPKKMEPKAGVRLFEKSPMETLESLAGRGNELAKAEIALRKTGVPGGPTPKAKVEPKTAAPTPAAPVAKTEIPQKEMLKRLNTEARRMVAAGEAVDVADAKTIIARASEQPKTKAVGKGGFARLKSETGSVGKDIEQRQIKKAEVEGENKTGMPAEFSPDVRRTDEFYPETSGTSPRWERLTGESGAIGPGRRRTQQGPGLYNPVAGGGSRISKGIDFANNLRLASMLSGLAVPKSALGNIGAHFAAAAESKSMAPIKALGDVRAIGRDLKAGWKQPMNPAFGGGSKMNIPGRIMTAGDYAATKSLQRSGLSEATAKEILLTNPNPVASWGPLNTALGKGLIPFKTTPFNQLGQGLSRYKKHPGVYAGAMGLGVGAGAMTDDPEALALMSAAAGPYALPFLAGASVKAGAHALQGISPIPEWSITKSLTEPWAPFTESPGGRWFKPSLGFGSSGKPKPKAKPRVKPRPTGRSSK